MKFSKAHSILLALVVIMSLMLAACGSETPTATAIPVPTDTAAPVVVPTDTTAPVAADTATTAPATEATATPAPAASGDDNLTLLAGEGIKPDAAAKGDFEFFSWWTAGGEAEGKNDILNLYKQLYPGVNVIDAAVAGGGGDQAKAVLKTRMQGDQPPDTFQVHAGPELTDGYVAAGKMEPITKLYTDMNMKAAFPQQLLDLVTVNGEIYSVPANIHRGNVLFYNKKVFADNGLKAPTTWDEFFTVADALKAKGIAPIAVGGKDTWSVTMLFEDILIAGGGADKFKALMAGQANWADPAVLSALTSLGKVFSGGYVNTDFAARTWDEAAGQVLKGTAGMTIMGDWAKGYYQANDTSWSTDIGWEASPGTSGVFKVISDSFGLPKGAKNAQNTSDFLALIGSKTGQVAFNLRKGSIPARTDVDTSKFDVYMKDAAADFKDAKSLVGSAPHGSATNDAFASALNTAINTFIANPGAAADAATQLASQAQDLLTGGSSMPPAPTPTAAPAAATGDNVALLAAEGIKPDAAAKGDFEFFSWWTAGGEAEGKNDILNLYKQLYGGVNVIDAAVAGGGGDQAKAVLKTRMQGDQPPDTFQVHAGPELTDGYVAAGKMEPITKLYTDMNMKAAFPQQLLDLVTVNGEIYSVPANIHRGNVLFYNKKVFADNGLKAPTTWDEFFTVADALKAKGIAPIAVGGKDTWSVTMLFEDILIAGGGADKFKALMSGDADWTDPAVVSALTSLGKVFSGGYVNTDFAARTWDEAAGQVLKGTAGMTIMGDWAKGYYQANDTSWSTDIGWEPSPGTTGVFKVISDSFGLPKGAKNADNTNRFLGLIGSKTGQVAFNLRKGSIPARTDVDTSKFDVYMKDAAADFASAKSLVGSAPHGSATNDAFASALNTAINTFIANPSDAASAAAQLLLQAQDLLK